MFIRVCGPYVVIFSELDTYVYVAYGKAHSWEHAPKRHMSYQD